MSQHSYTMQCTKDWHYDIDTFLSREAVICSHTSIILCMLERLQVEGSIEVLMYYCSLSSLVMVQIAVMRGFLARYLFGILLDYNTQGVQPRKKKGQVKYINPNIHHHHNFLIQKFLTPVP